MSLARHIHAAIRLSQATGKGRTLPVGAEPQEGLHKSYPRMPKIRLAPPLVLTNSFSETLKKRRSYTHIHTRPPYSLEEVSTLLGTALGRYPETIRRPYPSGGALYPIETYLCGTVLDTHPRAVFHYNPTNHELEHLWDSAQDFMFSDYTIDDVPPGDAFIILTSVWERTAQKYGDFGYSHALIEAGHMAQNILLTATALNIATRPIGGFRDDALSELLDLNTDEENIVYVIGLAGSLEHPKNHGET